MRPYDGWTPPEVAEGTPVPAHRGGPVGRRSRRRRPDAGRRAFALVSDRGRTVRSLDVSVLVLGGASARGRPRRRRIRGDRRAPTRVPGDCWRGDPADSRRVPSSRSAVLPMPVLPDDGILRARVRRGHRTRGIVRRDRSGDSLGGPPGPEPLLAHSAVVPHEYSLPVTDLARARLFAVSGRLWRHRAEGEQEFGALAYFHRAPAKAYPRPPRWSTVDP